MDAPLQAPHELVRPWRRATLVASAVAAIELVLLIGAGAMLVAKPLSHVIRHHAQVAALTPAKKVVAQAIHQMKAPPGRARPRGTLKIMVLNGNGQSGAAADEAGKLKQLGYRVAGTANAHRQDYASSVVMYSPGYRAEGLRLATDLGVKVVGPLDGMRKSTLHGGELAVILGA